MKSHVTWALVGASVVLLGFTSLQFTDAAWSSSDSTDGATVRTGHLRITGTGQMALDVSGLAKEEMAVGDQSQIPLTVVNDSTVPVTYRLDGVTAAEGTTPPELNLRVAQVSQERVFHHGALRHTGRGAVQRLDHLGEQHGHPSCGQRTGGDRCAVSDHHRGDDHSGPQRELRLHLPG